MDQIASLMNTFSPGVMGEFHPACLDTFCNQNSPYPMIPFGHRSSVSNQGQLEFNPPSYNQATNQQYGHSIPQNFQPNLTDRQMTTTFMCQNQMQHHTDSFYPYQAQTPPFYPQKHQSGPHQLMQSTTSPCLNQTSASVNVYQSHSPQFASISACPQNAQISPRHSGHHQTPQAPLLCSQKNQQIQSLHNQQHQQPAQMNGTTHSQRSEQSSKLVKSKQTNSPIDRITDQFYSTQCPQITDPSLSSFNNMMQSTSPAHVPHVFQTSGANSGNSVNSDSWSRSLHANKIGASGNIHSINQTKPSTYTRQNCYDQPNSAVASSLQQNRYGKNESTTANSQRIQKASPASSSLSYRPQAPGNQNFFVDHNLLPPFSDGASKSLVRPVHSKAPPPFDSSVGELPSVQNMHYKPTHVNREGKSISNQSKVNNRSVKSVANDSLFLESHLDDSFFTHRMKSTNSSTSFSTALSESARGVGRGNKVRDTTVKGDSRTNGPGKIAQKNMCDNLSPVHWYKSPGAAGASSFQSDIEAMQADVASYVSNCGVSWSNKATPVTHVTSTQKSIESNAGSKNELDRMLQTPDVQKSGSSSRTQGQFSESSKSENNFTSKVTREEALAAIQIKQEFVDNLNKYKTVSSSSDVNNLPNKTVPAAQSANQINTVSTGITNFIKDASNLTNRLSSVKDAGVGVNPKQQSDISVRRHSSAEHNPKIVDILQHPGPSPSMYIPTSNKTATAAIKTAADPQGQGLAHIQNRRHTASYLPDRISSINKYETACSPIQRPNVDAQKSPAVIQSKDNLEFPSQNIIHHLFDQIQNIDMQGSNGQQQNMITSNKAVQRDCISMMSINEQTSCESAFDNWTNGQISGSIQSRGVDQGRGHITAPITNKNPSKSSDLSNNITAKCTPAPIVMKENVKQAPNISFHNSINGENHVQKKIKIEISSEPNKPTTIVCYVMLHGHKLICLKSNTETLLLLCQFQYDCFPDRSLGSINTCIDNILQINRKVLNHQEKERIVLFLKRNGYHLGSMVQTISLDDAKRVYHHMYGITCCTNSTCVEMFHDKVDLEMSSSSNKPIMKELKKEKTSPNDNYGQLLSRKDSGTCLIPIARIEHGQRMTEIKNQIHDKPLKLTSLPPLTQKSFDSSENGCTVPSSRDVDYDESDDLIIVETPEDPNILCWTGNNPKTGGLCNTIVGQLRTYIHENERFLVVDDLCRVFGSADFYDGVERENIILYSCCPEIARFLNAISANFSPLQSLRDSLVKQKDIGIHVTDSNSVTVAGATEKSSLGSSFLKRPLCKMEILDDDCSSPKQFRLHDFSQFSELENQHPINQQPLANKKELVKETVINKDSLDHMSTDVRKPQNNDKIIEIMGGVINTVPVVSNELSISAKNDYPSSKICKTPPQLGQDISDEIDASSASLEITAEDSGIKVHVANSEVSSRSSDKNSISSLVIKSYNQKFENNNDSKSLCADISLLSTVDSLNETEQLAQQMHPSELPESIDCDIPNNAVIISPNLMNMKEAYNISLTQPLSPESSRSTASFGEPSPILIDLNNPTKAPSVDREKEQRNLKNVRPEFVSCSGQYNVDSLIDRSHNISNTESQNVSMQQLVDSENTSGSHDNNHLETAACKQTDNLKIIPFTDGIADNCLEVYISAQQNQDQGKVVSNISNSILKTRVEKLKKALETRRNNDLPLPKLLLDNHLNLKMLINNDCNAKDKNNFIDYSKTETVVQKPSYENFNSLDINSHTMSPINESDVSCTQIVLTHEICDKNSDSSHLYGPDGHKVAAKCGPQVVLLDIAEPSEYEMEDLEKEISRNNVSVVDQNMSRKPLPFLSLSKYFPGNRRSMDDTDVMFTGSFVSGVRGAFEKLWHEHRELLGVVDALKKNLAHEKAERERCEKISKYYEGVIHDITSTFKNGDEDDSCTIE